MAEHEVEEWLRSHNLDDADEIVECFRAAKVSSLEKLDALLREDLEMILPGDIGNQALLWKKIQKLAKLNSELEDVKKQIVKYEAMDTRSDAQEANLSRYLDNENDLKKEIKALEGSLYECVSIYSSKAKSDQLID